MLAAGKACQKVFHWNRLPSKKAMPLVRTLQVVEETSQRVIRLCPVQMKRVIQPPALVPAAVPTVKAKTDWLKLRVAPRSGSEQILE